MKNAFVVHVPFHYYLFRSIYRNLEESAFIVPPMSDKPMSSEYGGGMSAKGLHRYMYEFLKDRSEPVVDYGKIIRDNFIKYISQNVRNIVCPHYFDGIYEVQDTRIFGMVYGLPNSIDDALLSSVVTLLDYIPNFIMDQTFTFGPESVDRFNKRGLQAVEVGNPLFDYWFSNQVDELNLELIKKKLVKDAPTILYLPTHNYYSSYDKFIKKIINLSQKYNVIVKLHHITFNGEANRLCRLLAHPEIITLGDYFDPLPLYKVSDIVLTDVSGSLFDAILLQKPILMLEAQRQYKVGILENGKDGIAETGIVPYVKDPEHLDELIERNIDKPVKLDDKLMYSLYYLRDGKAGKRVADDIIEQSKTPPLSTIEKYDRAIERAPDQKNRQAVYELKNRYLRHYYPEQTKKPGIMSKISRHLFKI